MEVKKLTIEEKAKRYDEVIPQLKGLLDGIHEEKCDIMEEDIIKIFHELKESEDERISKYLIKYFEANKDELSKGFRWNGITVEKCIAWFEKQGEKGTNGNKREIPNSEQKPADKVEPEFHKGDWVILTAGELSTTLQIVNVDTNKKLYWFNDNSYLPIVDEECLHLWTIQDAKDGDVLYSPCCKLLFIFKNDKECYVGNNLNYHAESIVVNSPICVPTDSVPATKEQRDLLFAKMKEAGYEWDDEKKEPKKIEQNPAWSEEDEEEFQIAIDTLAEAGQHDSAHWLKSLKGRYIWKPSDEQLRELENVFSPDTDSWDEDILRGLYEQIKKTLNCVRILLQSR